MKKLNFAILGACLLTALATRALAETTIPWTKEGCESVKGTWITAHSATDDGCDAAHCNGKNFCEGPVRTTWFSALIWCKSIGHKLTDLETVCPNGLTTNACPNLNKTKGYWTDIPCNQSSVYYVDWSRIILCTSRTNTSGGGIYPLCKE